MTQYIGSNSLYGVNYAIFNKEEVSAIKACKDLQDEIRSYGYTDNQVLRKCEVSNGVVFDIDPSIEQAVLQEISDEMLPETGEDNPIYNEQEYTEARAYSQQRLVEECVKSVNSGQDNIEVVLYNLSQTNNILLPCVTEYGYTVVMWYPAFTLSLWDILKVQKTGLLSEGIQISKLEVCEVLPYKKGVRTILHLVTIGD